jgi:hypothetical protein
MTLCCLLRKSNLRWIVFILIPLYLVSLAGVFHFEKEQHQNYDASSIPLEVRPLNMNDQLSFFKQTIKNKQQQQQQQQQQRNNNQIKIKDTTSTSTSTGRHVMNNNNNQHDTTPHAIMEREKASIMIVGNNVPDEELAIVLRRDNNDNNNNDDNDNDGMLNKHRNYNDTTTTKIVVNHHQQGRRRQGRKRKREKLQVKLDRIAYENYTPNDNIPLWELSDYVPQWMKDYFDWHTEKRRTITPEDISIIDSSSRNSNSNNNSNSTSNSTSTRFLIVQCVQSNQDTNNICGSISERLLIVPYLLRLAYDTKRLLFIHWDVPVDIAYFLVPPIMGCDFRVPIWLRKIVSVKYCSVFVFYDHRP